MFHVYLLKSQKTGRRYVGSWENLEARVRRHNLGDCKATRYGVPWTLVHSETFSNRVDAARKERFTRQAVVVTNLTNCNDRAVAAATGRGFESRRPEFYVE